MGCENDMSLCEETNTHHREYDSENRVQERLAEGIHWNVVRADCIEDRYFISHKSREGKGFYGNMSNLASNFARGSEEAWGQWSENQVPHRLFNRIVGRG
jgi:hypothetical protein